jgi:tetratricopeptide (TPR) repeat protein
VSSSQRPDAELHQEVATCEAATGGAHAVSSGAKVTACSELLNSGRLTVRGRASVLVDRGIGFEAQKNTKLAAQDLADATNADPTYAIGWAQSCRFHTWSERDIDRAVRECAKSIELDPNLADGWTFRGDIYLSSQDYDKAISDYNHAIKLSSSWMWPWDNRGEAYLRSGRIDRAIEDFEMVIKLNPDYAMGYLDRGIARIRQSQPENAHLDFEQGLKVDPKCAACLYGLGVVRGLQGDKIGEKTDIEAAKAMSSTASENFERDGVVPR